MEYHEFYDKYRSRKLRTAAVRLHRIESLLPQGRRLSLLDIGSSLGVTLEAAKQRGWKAVGVDKRSSPAYGNYAGFARLSSLAQIVSGAGDHNHNAETN